MPAKTAKQQKYMAICAHSPGKAKGKCPSRAVAEEFSHKRGDPQIGKKRKKAARSEAIGRHLAGSM
jgi:hypothetical protein